MKKNAVYFFIIILVLVFQTAILPVVLSLRPLPSAVYMLAIAWVVLAGFKAALPGIVMAGLLFDLFFYQTPGTETIGLVVTAYFVSFFSRRFLIENKIWGSLIIFLFVIFGTLIQHVSSLVLIKTGSVSLASSGIFTFFMEKMPLQIVINLAIFYFFIQIFKKVENIKTLSAIR